MSNDKINKTTSKYLMPFRHEIETKSGNFILNSEGITKLEYFTLQFVLNGLTVDIAIEKARGLIKKLKDIDE